MEKYIKPDFTVNRIDFENCLLANTVVIDIVDDPSQKPGLSKGLRLFLEEEKEEKKGMWDE